MNSTNSDFDKGMEVFSRFISAQHPKESDKERAIQAKELADMAAAFTLRYLEHKALYLSRAKSPDDPSR